MMVPKCFQHISYGSPTLPSSYRKTTVSPKPSCSWKCGGVGPILWYCGWSTVQRFLLFWKTTVPPKRSFSNIGYLVPMNTTLLYIVAFDHYIVGTSPNLTKSSRISESIVSRRLMYVWTTAQSNMLFFLP